MKALTITQPWAQLIIDRRKYFETRGWATNHRDVIAIHAAKGWTAGDRAFATEVGYVPADLARGVVLGIARIIACTPADQVRGLLPAVERAFGDFGPDRWAWQLSVVDVFAEPLPARGALGLWTWEP